MGVGFLRPNGRSGHPDGRSPFLTLITNFFSPRGGWLAEAEREFQTTTYELPLGQPYLLFECGQSLTKMGRIRLERNVRRLLDRDVCAHAAARILAREVREISNTNAAVGGNVMCTVLPRGGIRPGNPNVRGGLIPIVRELMSEADFFRYPRGERDSPSFVYSPLDPKDAIH